MKIKLIISTLTLIIISSASFAGGGWTKPKKKSYIKVAGWWIESKDFFSGNGEETSGVTSGLFNINVYAEYGFTDKLTAIAYVPFFSRSYQNKQIVNGELNSELPGGDLNSIGDSELGLKYSLFNNGKIAIAGSIILGLPIGNDGSDQTVALATGDGEFNQIVRADIGVSLINTETFSLYGNTYLGINNRTKGFSDELRAGVEFGAGFANSKLWVIGKLDTIQSLNNGDTDKVSANASIFANNAEATSLSTEVAYYLTEKIGINASVAIPLAGQNVFNAPAYSAGIFLDVK